MLNVVLFGLLILATVGTFVLVAHFTLNYFNRKACREGAKRLMKTEASSLFESEDDCYEFLLRTLRSTQPWRRAR